MITATMGNHPNRGRADKPGRTPSPAEIRQAREEAGLTQAQAAELIHATLRTWQNWEMPADTIEHRRMHAGLFELFQAKLERPELFQVGAHFPEILRALQAKKREG